MRTERASTLIEVAQQLAETSEGTLKDFYERVAATMNAYHSQLASMTTTLKGVEAALNTYASECSVLRDRIATLEAETGT
jgi:peptidoglycan hydrolase CwlO-like protein